MPSDDSTAKARSYLETLCSVKPNRRTGSPGNREATAFVADVIGAFGYDVDATPFDCLDHVSNGAELTRGGEAFEVCVSPYSLGCDVTAELVAVATVEELERSDCAGKLLLLHGDICAEQLMPKNFVFYNPESHQRVIALLEERQPAAIVTATGRNPGMVGALYPFPLIVDGDFDIPNVHCRDTVGQTLAPLQGDTFRLAIDARRLPATGSNVIARLNPGAARKIVLTAHLDAYDDSPGALDDAAGVVVLMLCAEMLAGGAGPHGIEIVAINGEDHYSAGGEMDYLARYGESLPAVLLNVNVDDVGYREGASVYSFYECSPELEALAESVFARFDGLARGEPWYMGDHMVFVQKGIPAIALTAERMPELMRTVTHTAADTPDLVDAAKLVEVAEAIAALVRAL